MTVCGRRSALRRRSWLRCSCKPTLNKGLRWSKLWIILGSTCFIATATDSNPALMLLKFILYTSIRASGGLHIYFHLHLLFLQLLFYHRRVMLQLRILPLFTPLRNQAMNQPIFLWSQGFHRIPFPDWFQYIFSCGLVFEKLFANFSVLQQVDKKS